MAETGTSAPSKDVLTQPILNTPYQQPGHHWRLDEHTQRALDEPLTGRRPSGAYLPVPKHRADGTLLLLETATQVPPHPMINEIRKHVKAWRDSGWKEANRVTRELLEYWTGDEVSPRPFFCQVEAIETIVWLHEAGRRFARTEWNTITKMLAEINQERNEGIERVAIKMATGTGKTRLMQMLICWAAVNAESGVEFLAITPGLTVRERLEELKPVSSGVYDELLPPGLRERIHRAKVTVLNFQSFRKRDKLSVAGEGDQLSGAGKKLLKRGRRQDPENWKETDKEMLNRLLRSPRTGKVIVLNDEAHHCYAPPPSQGRGGEEKEYEETAALWFNALRSLQKTRRLGMVYDFSATPMYLRVPVGLPSEIFPWTVTDYPLIEAIEAGLTKIPRVPVSDDSDKGEPVYRNVYGNTNPTQIDLRRVPTTVTSLLEQMHEHYDTVNQGYVEVGERRKPVMIVVANSIENATALYGHIAGYHDGDKWVRGCYEHFSNVLPDGSRPKPNPPTLLVHSGLDAPEDLPKQLEQVLVREAEVHTPGIDGKGKRLERVREIFNTVGKIGEPGEHIRCIVSVSMLTEGWDARTVTHIFGYRRFGTQLLCEQVAGRGLRRTSFECEDEHGFLPTETVNIFGVPFNFMRAADDPTPGAVPEPYRVYSVPERADTRRVTFPNIASYRVEVLGQVIALNSDKVRSYEVEPTTVPSVTEVMGMTGESHITELTEKRRQCVLYRLAALLLAEFYVRESRRRGLFQSALTSVQAWLAHSAVVCPDWRLLLVEPHISSVPQEIARCCSTSEAGAPTIVPVFADQVGPAQSRSLDTGDIDFETTKPLFHDTIKSELNRAPCDSRSEMRVAEALDSLDGISAWARNFRLGWKIPYLDQSRGVWKNYVPDFVARIRHGPGKDEQVHLVIEYKGQVGEDSDKKTKAVEEWWLPSVNGSSDPCCAGEWRYVFIEREDDIYPKLLDEIRR